MADIHIDRDHTLGLAEARKLAFRWAEQAENKFDMDAPTRKAGQRRRCSSRAPASTASSR